MKNTSPSTKKHPRRVAIVGGLRTPFVKSQTLFRSLSAIDLAIEASRACIQHMGLPWHSIERVVLGQVVISPQRPNIAREVVLGLDLPPETDAYSVSRACATGTQAIIDGAMAILHGDIEVALCGGADSLSRPPITYSAQFIDALMTAHQAKDALGKARPFLNLAPKDWLPQPPALREYSTGLTMGESAEKMAQENGITREEQDLFALRSHQRAAAAWESGIFAEEVMALHVPPYSQPPVEKDNLVRPQTDLASLSKLKPAFDKSYGSITAGTSSPLTDGAAVVVLMSEHRAQALGYEPLAYIRSWACAAVNPHEQLLSAPAIAIPKALKRAEISPQELTWIDMHEAFAAQVLSNTQALSQHWGMPFPTEKLNIYGGSIALGHPFAATGARQALTMARALARQGHGLALISQCAAGGLGAALILER